MKVVYRLPVRLGLTVPVPRGTPELKIDNAVVEWTTNKENCLETVVFEFTGVEIMYTEDGSIVPAPAVLQEQAYRVASYVANRLYIQTSIEAIDPERILLEAPAVSPENNDEENEFKKTPRRMWTSVKLGWAIHGSFQPGSYDCGYDHSAAFGYYADALRAASVFQKFELFYKVLEYFFSETGLALDKAVSAYLTPYDAIFTPDAVKTLRNLRNRSVHPRARKGRISPQNIANVKEVHAKLQQMHKLVSLLLEHPTF